MPEPEPLAFSVSDTIGQDPYKNGLFIAGITNDQVQAYGEFYNDLYQKVRDRRSRQVTRNALTMLRGAIFALGTQSMDNPEWQEHCGSSIREIFHEWTGLDTFKNDFKEFYPDGWRTEDAPTFSELWSHYQYFTGIDHHEASGVLASLQSLLNNRALKQEDCYKEGIFVDRVKRFLQITAQVIEFSKRKKETV